MPSRCSSQGSGRTASCLQVNDLLFQEPITPLPADRDMGCLSHLHTVFVQIIFARVPSFPPACAHPLRVRLPSVRSAPNTSSRIQTTVPDSCCAAFSRSPAGSSRHTSILFQTTRGSCQLWERIRHGLTIEQQAPPFLVRIRHPHDSWSMTSLDLTGEVQVKNGIDRTGAGHSDHPTVLPSLADNESNQT